MPTQHGAAWKRNVTGQGSQPSGDGAAALSTDVVQYGPDIGTETDFRLLGDLDGKRVLELGCGGGHGTAALARKGAHVIAVDSSAERVTAARRLAERAEVRVEVRHGDLADLAFVRGDAIDLAFSAYALNHVDDLNRVFRQVHRVLKTSAPLVFSVPHPAYDMLDDDDPDLPLLIRRPYFDRQPVTYEINGAAVTDHRRTISDLITALTRANFSIDTLLEPEPLPSGPRSPFWRDTFAYLPRTLIVRARKEGI